MSWGSGMAAIGAGVVARKRRQIIRAYRTAGATTAANARSPQELGLSRGVVLHLQRLRGVLVETEPGRYFLDERREAEVAKVRRLLVFGILAIGVVAVIALSARS